MTDESSDRFVVIEEGATGSPRVHGPFDTRGEAQKVADDWAWSRWTTRVVVGVLGNPKFAAYSEMGGRGWSE